MRFRPLHADLGAEVLDFDVQNGGTPDEIEELRRAYDRYSLLLFRGGGRIAPERHLEFTRWFGPPDPVDGSGDGNYVGVLQNDDAAGRIELEFHSDLTYTDCPIKAICLHAIALPERPTSTTFVSGRAAWAKLPAGLRDDLADKTLHHHYEPRTAFNMPAFDAEHPLRLIHPRTGEPILFATQMHAERILEMDEVFSRAVIDDLFATLYAPEARYEHVWQLDDLLMWDNLAIQHARTEEARPDQGKRALQRVALAERNGHDRSGRSPAAAMA